MDSNNLSYSLKDEGKREMYESFHYWAIQNYGDSGKTKTVTHKKYQRITDILTGDEPPTAGNSKFRFWVKAKGFRLGPVDGSDPSRTCLYVPTKPVTDSNSNDTSKEYKRVAIVEDFFDIIYGVHVEMDGRGGNTQDKKRTYRAIAEKYAFLPREAVTRFLMSCSDCQKRMHLSSADSTNNESVNSSFVIPQSQYSFRTTEHDNEAQSVPIVDFNMPITQTYLNHLKYRNLHTEVYSDEESMSTTDSLASEASPVTDVRTSTPVKDAPSENGDAVNGPVNLSTPKSSRSTDSPMEDDKVPIAKSPTPRNDRKRRASDDSSVESSTKTSEVEMGDDQDGKDDDDDNDDDDDEKIPVGKEIDPERLKAFNMFVRLFVDENLDRIVPISKQPKDKVQAILEACDRQFPEFHERSRKRIRTYLKSCRRMRRTKEQNGWEPQLRPTPPHLTSAAAEGLLSSACENESNNAKRMRMGLEPLPASVMNAAKESSTTNQSQTSTPQSTPSSQKQTTPPPPAPPAVQVAHSRSSPAPQPSATPQAERHSQSNSDFLRHQPPPPAFRPPPEFHSPFFPNGNGLFRPGFPPTYQHPAHHHPTVLSHSSITANSVQNGPTDLSLKKNSAKNQLSSTEITTIKQLIAGYRESAAFLYRSADELEQLLLQQN
ncbi:Nucleolar protein 4,Nucleolar protein 4-like [Mytilus edulis]|uniref:Nucleolar protein 4,Nucleolar protein 4-like n=1 Tax=Mytilus edulis TaxID=6550 RepID=A0A8S3QDT1_MYTED|nr:Nucleolar protein 4,Nucleolar protein 4-like [Mytilus edulis]